MASELEALVWGDEDLDVQHLSNEEIKYVCRDDCLVLYVTYFIWYSLSSILTMIGTCRATIRALGDEISIMRSDIRQIAYETKEQRDHIKDNIEKVKVSMNTTYIIFTSIFKLQLCS
jgi:hypothetical protein